jgi:DNA-binding NarL/FixJ family response regulator
MSELTGRQLCIVGANQLQNELLAYYITSKVGASCEIVAELSSVPAFDPATAAHKRLVLFDFSRPGETVESLIDSDKNNIIQTDYLVLINLSTALNIEIEALHCGVRGFMYYQGGLSLLVAMIRAVLKSELWIPSGVISELILLDRVSRKTGTSTPPGGLSPREVSIVKSLAQGFTNAMIADTHCLSPHTVKTHLHHIFRKLHVSTRLQAAQWASDHL